MWTFVTSVKDLVLNVFNYILYQVVFARIRKKENSRTFLSTGFKFVWTLIQYIYSFPTPDKGVSFTLAIILQYMNGSNQHIVHLQLCYIIKSWFQKRMFWYFCLIFNHKHGDSNFSLLGHSLQGILVHFRISYDIIMNVKGQSSI